MVKPKYCTRTLEALSFLTYLFIQIGFAQIPPDQMRFDHLSSIEGLSAGNVTCILQDHLGYIWIGTTDGLNRFDGYSVTSFFKDPSDSNSLSGNEIRCLFEDHRGIIWIGASLGLNTFDQDSYRIQRFVPPAGNFPPISAWDIRAICEDGDYWHRA